MLYVNIRLGDGETVLMFAAQKNSFDTIKLLLENGADPHARDNERYSAVSYTTSDKIKHLIKVYE